MPYASEAQRRKFHAMLERGEISEQTVKEWDKASKGKKLPERVKKKASYAQGQDPTGANAQETTMSCAAFERVFFQLPPSGNAEELATRIADFTHAAHGKIAAAEASQDVTDEQIQAAFAKRASALTLAERLVFAFAPQDQFAQS